MKRLVDLLDRVFSKRCKLRLPLASAGLAVVASVVCQQSVPAQTVGQAVPNQLIVLEKVRLADTVRSTMLQAAQSAKIADLNDVQDLSQPTSYLVSTTNMTEAEAKLKSNPNLVVQRNFVLKHTWVIDSAKKTSVPNDPYFSSQWHLAAINAPKAWYDRIGNFIGFVILSTGVHCPSDVSEGIRIRDLTKSGNPTVYKYDPSCLGTRLATIACGTANNRSLGAGVVGATLRPLVISTTSMTTTAMVVKGVIFSGGANTLVIPYNSPPPNSLSNREINTVLHHCLKLRYDHHGLTFCSAGNDGKFDPNPRVLHLLVVTAMNKAGGLATFSNYGNNVWFTAPGESVYTGDRANATYPNGRTVCVSGTSYAAAIAGAVSHMGRGNGITSFGGPTHHYNVILAMRNTATRRPATGWNMKFGYGCVNAAGVVSSFPSY
jgi:hypothetical protein